MDKDDLEEDLYKYTTRYQTYLSHVFETSKGSQTSSHFNTFKSSWTSEEKDLFFHGLCIHSRLRPDLIAEEIATKSIAEVCDYLSSLDEASKGDDYNSSTNASEAAREMSDNWVIFEERCAAELVANEPEWDIQASVLEHKIILEEERAALRKKKGEGDRRKRDRAGEKLRSKTFEDTKERLIAIWKREDFLKSLSPVHLSIIDNIFRESEEKLKSSSLDSIASIQTIGTLSTSKYIQQAVADSNINTVLLNTTTPQSLYATNDSSILNTAEQISPGPPLYATQPSIKHSDQDHMDDAEQEDISNLSPVSRRRHQKRLYMRRKRAEASGRSASYEIGRLKPGRRSIKCRKEKEQPGVRDLNADPKSPKSIVIDITEITQAQSENLHPDLANAPPSSRFRSSSSTEAENVNPEEIPEKDLNISGPTFPYKLKLQMAELGLDASALSTENFDLIRLSRLGKLMRLFVSLNNVETGKANHISSETIKFLLAHLICFLTDLMHRIIVLKEQEDMSKKHTTVWRRREKQVTSSSVHQALEMMNAWINKRQYFSDFLNHFREESVNGVTESEEERMDDEASPSDSLSSKYSDELIEDSIADEDSDDDHSVPFKRRDIAYSDLWQSLSRDLYTLDDDYEIMSISSDEENIAELEREDEIDIRDHETDIAYEYDLWRKFGRDSQGLPIYNGIKSTNEVNSSQNLPNTQNPANIYKSTDYILDSD